MRQFYVYGRSGYYVDYSYTDRQTNEVIFASIVSYANNIDYFSKSCKGKLEAELTNSYKKSLFGNINTYFTERSLDSKTDLCHLTMLKMPEIDAENKHFKFYLLTTEDTPNVDEIFQLITNFSTIPLKQEWANTLIDELIGSRCIRELPITNMHPVSGMQSQHLWEVALYDTTIERIVKVGVSDGKFIIKESATSSSLENTVALDSYLPTVCDQLTTRIQSQFKPRFNPLEAFYSARLSDFEDWYYNDGNGKQLYDAQKSIIEAVVRTLKDEHRAIVVGEMGAGKTAISLGILYCLKDRLGLNFVIMCPTHLLHQWREEITDSSPNAVCHIITSIKDIRALEADINNPLKPYNLYMLISYENAKTSYTKMPCPIFKSVYNEIAKNSEGKDYIKKTYRDVYVCPKCGKLLTKLEKHPSKKGAKNIVPMTIEDFKKENSFNVVCANEVLIYDAKKNDSVKVVCGEKLWRPVIKGEEVGDWIKIDGSWYHMRAAQALYAELSDRNQEGEDLTRKEQEKLSKIEIAFERIDSGKNTLRALYKYPLAAYINRKFKNMIECTVFDEIHKLAAEDSEQGKAMSHLVSASKNVLGLTGTLINGKAESLYYILYRMFPRTMRKYGIEYTKEKDFLKAYGSSKIVVSTNNDGSTRRNASSLPGVSPTLFCDFLLDVGAFICLDDIAEGLPGYQEIPMGIELDNDIANAYENLKEAFKDNTGYCSSNNKCASKFMQYLSLYPDMPYNCPPVINPDTDEIVYEFENNPSYQNNKLEATMRIVDEKIANGEKVLIYYYYTNISDVGQVIKNACEEKGYHTELMLSSSSKTVNRSEWIKKQLANGLEVLICNPNLVETGLNLLDFTTIIFYQMDYKISTVRQASRRSYRLNQTKDVEVYFMYYAHTAQQDIISLMGAKLQASMTAEGKIPAEGLCNMSLNDDLTTQIANNVIKGVQEKLDLSSFNKTKRIRSGDADMSRFDKANRKTRDQIRYHEPVVETVVVKAPVVDVLPVKTPVWADLFKKNQPKKAKSDDVIFSMINKSFQKWGIM